MKYDVVALGELLIDFTENGISSQQNPLFEANPGGAPCNVLAMLARLGRKTAFIGKVGNDFFGHQLKKAIEEVGIDSQYLLMDNEVPTTLAFVHTQDDGDREFSFYRNPGADMMLKPEEISEDVIRNSHIFHFGTLSMTDDTVREATLKALETAKAADTLISFDPNLRPALWEDLEMAREQVLCGMEYCDILKIADNEIVWLTGENDYRTGIKWILDRFDISLIFVTLGKEGSMACYKGEIFYGRPFLRDDTIETTGAGDTFDGCVLDYLCGHELHELAPENINYMLKFANAAASIITTRRGALRMMPTLEEIKEHTDEP